MSFWKYCEIILIRGAFNYVEFVGKTIHEFKYQQYKIPLVRLWNARYACKPMFAWWSMLDCHVIDYFYVSVCIVR